MEKFVYCSPTKIVFGRAAEEKTAELVKECGGSRVFIVYGGQSAVKSGLIGRIEKMLADAGIEHLAMGGVVPNPLVSTARKMAKAAIDFKADFILGVGGGSVMNTAKAVAHRNSHESTFRAEPACAKKRRPFRAFREAVC